VRSRRRHGLRAARGGGGAGGGGIADGAIYLIDPETRQYSAYAIDPETGARATQTYAVDPTAVKW